MGRLILAVEMASSTAGAATGWYRGRVKAVPSGDCLVITAMASSKPGPPPEKTITLSSLIAPRLVSQSAMFRSFTIFIYKLFYTFIFNHLSYQVLFHHLVISKFLLHVCSDFFFVCMKACCSIYVHMYIARLIAISALDFGGL